MGAMKSWGGEKTLLMSPGRFTALRFSDIIYMIIIFSGSGLPGERNGLLSCFRTPKK